MVNFNLHIWWIYETQNHTDTQLTQHTMWTGDFNSNLDEDDYNDQNTFTDFYPTLTSQADWLQHVGDRSDDDPFGFIDSM